MTTESTEATVPPVPARNRFVDPAVDSYAAAHSEQPSDLHVALQETTREKTGDLARMQIGHDQAVLMEILARAIGARNAVEVGTFTGYSALAVSRGMGPDGHLLCLDVSEEWTAIAREHWERAGVADRIELRLGPALDSLRALPATEQFDLAFVDADKGGYPDYYRELLPRLRPGGLILADNTLQSGRVLDPADEATDTVAIRAFNRLVADDPLVQTVLLPLGDGVTVIQKRVGT